jgi:GDP-L-fucose synthase
MKVLVTGATGFLGSLLTKKLQEEGHSIVALGSKVADLTKQGSLDQFNNQQYDMIYHLAAWTQAGDFCLYHPGEQWIINQQINSNVLTWWQQSQPQAQLISMGTSCSYAPDMELKEEYYLTGTPIDSLYTYAMTKRMMQVGLQALNKQFGLKYLTVVPSTLYGLNYHTDGRQMHFIFDLIRKIIRGKEFGDKVELWGDGHQRREIVYIDDFINIMLKLSTKLDNDIINIGAGEDYSIRDFASKICDVVGYDFSKIGFDTSKYVGAKSKCLNVQKLKTLLPDNKMTSLEDGLRKTIEWFYQSKVYDLK